MIRSGHTALQNRSHLITAVRLVELRLQAQHLGPHPPGTVQHLALSDGGSLPHGVPPLHHHPGPQRAGRRVVSPVLPDKSPDQML